MNRPVASLVRSPLISWRHLVRCSRRQRRYSCASSCRPSRKPRATIGRLSAKARGANDGPAHESSWWTSISSLHAEQKKLGFCFFWHLCECPRLRMYAMSGGVRARHCSVAFMKHELPRLLSPVPSLLAWYMA